MVVGLKEERLVHQVIVQHVRRADHVYPRQEQAVERILKVLVPAGVFTAFYHNVPVARHRYAGIEHLPVLRENAFVLIEHVRDHAHAHLADVGKQLLTPVRA